MQELGLIPDEVDIKTLISVNARNDQREVKIHTHGRFLPAQNAVDAEADAAANPPSET